MVWLRTKVATAELFGNINGAKHLDQTGVGNGDNLLNYLNVWPQLTQIFLLLSEMLAR